MANKNINRNTSAENRGGTAAAFGGLSRRDLTLLLCVILIAIACALFFFLFKPGFENLKTLESEAAKAEDTQQEYSNVIAQGQGASEQIAAAIASYDEAKKRLFPQMLSEALDSTVTSYVVQAGFEPQSLSLSSLSPESPAPFVPPALNPDQQLFESSQEQAPPEGEGGEQAPPAEGTEDVTGESDIMGAANVTGAFRWDGSPFLIAYAEDGTEGADATVLPGEEPAVDAEPTAGEAPAEETEKGGSIYSYTVSVTVGGSVSNFYKLLDMAASTDGMEIMQYSLPTETGDESEAAAEKTSWSFAITLYVFIEENMQYVAPEAEATPEGVDGAAGIDEAAGAAEATE